jgi:pilus assembly protein CpaC
VRAKVGISIACFSALSIAVCAAPSLQAQTGTPRAPLGGLPNQDSANELSVAVGKSVLVDCARPVARVAIGLGDVAEADAISPTEIMVDGKAAGETSLIIWDTGGGRQFFNVSVRASATATSESLEAVRRELRSEFPGENLKVSSENGTIFLRGTVKDLASSDRAAKIATTAGKVVNLLYVNVPAADPQILLKVRFASIDRSKERQLGINFFSTGFANTIGGISTGEFSPPVVSFGPGTPTTLTFANQLNLLAFLPGSNVGADIQALVQQNVVQILSEPNIVAQNGKEASFLAGGEYPYPVVQGGGAGTPATVTIQFKEYGVRLNFIATILPSGTIRLQVAPEVSTLDFSNAVELSGFEVPAISTRKVNTEVDLADGQSFVIGGLLDKRDTESFEKIPFLGDIPILGKFFQSSQVTKSDTELLVLVTPEIVKPIEVGAARPELKYPNKFLPPNSGIPMNTPDAKAPGETAAAPPATLPVESVVDSNKPEKPLIIEGASGYFGAASTSTSSSSTSTSGGSTPQQ